MTTPTPPANGSDPMTLAEIRALLEQTAKAATENTRAIIEMRAANAERDARHDREMAAMRDANAERDARHDREIAAIHSAISKLTEAQHRTNQDVSTLKGWGLEIYCERNPEIFAEALLLKEEELIPRREIRQIASAAALAGVITPDQRRNLGRADVFIYGRRESDNQPLCLVVETSFKVQDDDVLRAADRADILGIILQKHQPRYLSGLAVPVVAGSDISDGTRTYAQTYGVTYVAVQNGNQLTTPPE